MDTQTLLESFDEIRENFKDLFKRVSQLEVEPKILASSGGGAPVDAEYLVNSANAVLTNEIVVTAAQGRIIYGDGTPIWTTLNIGTAYQLLGVNAGGILPEWQAFDWDLHVITAGGDGVHSHANNNEGGQLDHANLTNVLADQHHTGFIGLEDTATTAVSPAADDRIQLNSTSGALSIVSDVGNNKIDFTVNLTGLTHNLLSTTHSDTVVNAVTRGSLVYGNSTPAWDELVVGTNDSILTNDGTDVAWSTYYINGTTGKTLVFQDSITFSSTVDPIAVAFPITAAQTNVITTTADGATNHSTILASSAAGAITMDDYFTVDGGQFGITGNELLTVNAAGYWQFSGSNVGILTAPTNASLHVYRNATIGMWGALTLTNAVAKFEDSAANLYTDGNTLITDSTTSLFIGTSTSGNISFGTNDTERITIDTDLNFIVAGSGITHVDGNTDGYVLRANGTRYIPAQLDYTDLANVSSLAGDGLSWDAGNDEIDLGTPTTLTTATGNTVGAATHAHAITTSSDGTASPSTIAAFNASGQLTASDYFTNDGGTFGISGNELLTVNAAGYFTFNNASLGVGIVPVSQFHVYQNTTDIGTGTGITIEQDGTGDAQLQFLLTGAQRWVAGIDNSDNDKFKIGRNTAWGGSENIVITTGDFVGVNVSPTNASLHVYRNASVGTWGALTLTNAAVKIEDSSVNLYMDGNALITDGSIMVLGSTTGTINFGTNNAFVWQMNASGDFIDQTGSYIELQEMSAPGAGAANTMRMYAVDDGGGQTALGLVNSSGDTFLLHDGLLKTTEETYNIIVDSGIGTNAFALCKMQLGANAYHLWGAARTVTSAAITIIANGVGDANIALRTDWKVVRTSDNDYNFSNAETVPGGSATMYSDAGDVVTLTHNADGSVTIGRSSGSDSFDIYIDMEWIYS